MNVLQFNEELENPKKWQTKIPNQQMIQIEIETHRRKHKLTLDED